MKIILCTLISLPLVCAAKDILPEPLIATIASDQSQPASALGEPHIRAFFATDSTVLSAAAKSALKPLIMKHRYSPIHEFLLSGHADSRGPRDYNMLLSKRRVDAVISYLIEQGVRPDSINARNYGETRAAINIRDTGALILDRQVIVTINTRPQAAQRLAIKDS